MIYWAILYAQRKRLSNIFFLKKRVGEHIGRDLGPYRILPDPWYPSSALMDCPLQFKPQVLITLKSHLIHTSFPFPADENYHVLRVMRGVGFAPDIAFSLIAKSSILVSSDQSTFSHMFGESPTCLLVNTKRVCLFLSLSNGFYLVTLP
jgi:hypothetical protein